MKNLEEALGTETDRESNDQEREDQSETSHNKSPLLSDPWKPCRRPRVIVKEWLLKLSCCLGAVCGMQWYGFAALGILMAFLSFLMDLSVTKLLRAHQWLYTKLEGNTLLQFFCWTLYPSCLCAVASSFSHNICPFSTGSGIPEVRTMLAGIEMPHYLSLTNMFTKFLGLICTLAAGSTVFLGKVGPFVHLSTMMGAYLSHLCSLIQANEKVKADGEMLVVAAAVGVASCFGAPISGVLFTVEVMCSHFALRHYVPCFFTATCGALTFRLLSVWSGDGGRVCTRMVAFLLATVTPFPLYRAVVAAQMFRRLSVVSLLLVLDVDVLVPRLHPACAIWILHASLCLRSPHRAHRPVSVILNQFPRHLLANALARLSTPSSMMPHQQEVLHPPSEEGTSS
ncbi:chloride channel protein ClC-Ka [Lates japonicus]|uniref:Chloride channel protein ClC-Ka n=1 Tax=Lates japonicus TaxID=270547 RepID=A0AAD3R112_LATJO|nr:chloride channel protein ClC-Ka [Lates japonicus]